MNGSCFEGEVAQRPFGHGHPLLIDAREHALDRLGAKLVRNGVDDGHAEGVVLFREEVIPRFGEAVARGRTAGAVTLRIAGDLRLDPSFALQLQELLADGFSGELQFFGELRNRGGAFPLQRVQDRAAAIRQLVDREDDGLL